MPHLKGEVAKKLAGITLGVLKTTTPIFDGGVLRGRSCGYLINLDGLFSVKFTLILRLIKESETK